MNLFTCTDVTAVKIYKNCVLAGIGSKINIFDKLSSKLWQRVDGLNGQKIYGFLPSQCCDKILVFGGKQFTVLSVSYSTESGLDDGLFYKLFEPIVCDDWIHSAVWIGDSKLALLTAHNVVQKWDTSTQTLMSQHPSKDNSILYSGLLLPLGDDVLVMAGTVFSEVIIHRIRDQEPLHNLKGHKGVIFSISCKPEHNMIVTTSDDRSVRIWCPNVPPTVSHDSIDYWATVNFVCHHELYGHMARVMRSCITNNLVISVGEDSFICYWDYHGKLLRKVLCHQNSAIWSIDSDNHEIVTGGGDGAVVMHPLTVATDYCKNETINIDIDASKKVVFTARRNIVLLDANNLIQFNFDTGNKTVFKLNHETTYQMLSVSSCKQMIAVTDMNGKLDVFIENCKDEACIIKIIDTVLNIGKILSMQFAGNRHIVLCTENGEINVLASNNKDIEVYGNYILPPCKERWLTASAIGSTNKILIAGDRCGSVHVYVRGEKHPVRSFNKVHGRYGPTSINIRNNEVVTTGRDGSVKYFTINKNDGVKYMCARDLDFQWVEKFLDKDETMICGFQERVFVVYNVKDNSRILEVLCGGGHRSWDAIRYFDKENNDYEEYIKLIYLKNSDINLTTFKLSDIVSRSIINGSHSKEINCLKTYTNDLATFYITGGEDTTLRISSLNRDMKFKDEVVFKHLSSIRTLKTYIFDDNFFLISAGGRAQICIKNIKFLDDYNQIIIKSEELINYMIKGTDKERKGNQTWRNCTIDFDPEMRIMDLAVTRIDDKIIIFAGCSDAFLRVFTFRHKLEPIGESKYHSTCILKTDLIEILNKCVLITCTTRGDVTFWDVSDLTKLMPFFATKTNKSGINGFTSTILSKDMILIGTGGDDNAIHLVLLKIQDQNNLSSMQILNTWNTDKHHSSQITGLILVDNFLLSASIDQRVTLLEWEVKDNIVRCDFVSQAFTDVADVQGMELLSHKSDAITICVFGKGMEVLDMAPKLEIVTEPVWLGEGPHWDSGEQALYFVSIFDNTINKYTPATGKHTKAKLDGMPTFIIPIEGRRHHFVVGLNRKVLEVQWSGEENTAKVVRTIVEVDLDNPNNRFNDAKADPRGRLFAGTMGHEYEPGKFHLKKGSLYRIDPDGSAHKMDSNIDISNGLCWDLKEKAFYFTDSFEYAVRRYDYDVETGNISNPKLVFVYKDHGLEGIVDGMTIDTEGNLWIANFDGRQVIKVDPRTGKLLQKIPIPALQVTSATFGGTNLDELYVTSASMNRGEEQLPPCGSTFRLTGLGVKGHPNVSVKLN